jgi:hypothetical protein
MAWTIMRTWTKEMSDAEQQQIDDLSKVLLGFSICRVDKLDAQSYSQRVSQPSSTIRELGGQIIEEALTKLRIAVQQTEDAPARKQRRIH